MPDAILEIDQCHIATRYLSLVAIFEGPTVCTEMKNGERTTK